MFHLTPRTEEQENWLAQVSEALADAERLTGLLALARPRDDLALASLQAQIMALRQQIDLIRRKPSPPRPGELPPQWMGKSAWCHPEPAR